MLTDQGTARRAIVIRLSDQRAFLYKDGALVAISPASTGREGYNTPTGKYRVIGKDIDHRSSLYGEYARNGRVVKAGVDVRKDRKPPGAVFVGAPMPYLPANRSLVWTACRPCPRLPGFPWMHQAAKPLGQTFLLRRESGNASVDISVANVPPASVRNCHFKEKSIVAMEPDAARELEAEIELVRQVGQGDQRSFAALYDRFAMVLFSTAFRVLRNQEAAEDVLQEVFVQIWKKAPLYDSTRGRPLTWALTLTRNKAIDVLRSMQRRSCLQGDVQQDRAELRALPGSKLLRFGHLRGDKQTCPRHDSSAAEPTARGHRTRILFLNDAHGNRRALESAAGHNQGTHSPRDDGLAGVNRTAALEQLALRGRHCTLLIPQRDR